MKTYEKTEIWREPKANGEQNETQRNFEIHEIVCIETQKNQ